MQNTFQKKKYFTSILITNIVYKFFDMYAFNLFSQLLEYHSNFEDLRYKDLFSPLPQQIEKVSSLTSNNISQQIDNIFIDKQAPSKRLQLPKTKQVHKTGLQTHKNNDDYFSSSNSTRRVRRKGRRDRCKNSTYPTNNFLPNSKKPHIQFLAKYIGDEIYQHQFIQYLRTKDGINMEDYQTLYNFPQFRQAFSAMFAEKFLYRSLLLSRSSARTKIIHQRKLYVFEQAFRTQQFTRIN